MPRRPLLQSAWNLPRRARSLMRVLPLALVAVVAGWGCWSTLRVATAGAESAEGALGVGAAGSEERSMTHPDRDQARKNRLAAESSPYLLLHQENPVDWYPWGREALERARQEGKPIFLSVGYSTCYWCHVMERESFSDPAVAELMNRHFINIKVDREERPDLDEIYMAATQILSGHGGWPNSVFLTPDLKPFYAGTYFPPEDRYGRPGFPSVLRGLTEAWENRRSETEAHAEEVTAAMRRFLEERSERSESPPSPRVAERSLEALSRNFDAAWGGFGQAPKFPTPSNLFLLLELAGEQPEAGKMLAETLDQMVRGGIYDQLGGGFHRYSTDREWKIPHFEKMLYDNGFLLELTAREHGRTGDPEMARAARETAGFLLREMTSPEGAFLSAIDAETEAREGAFYVWTREELEQVLGKEDSAFLAPLYGFEGPPFFEGREYVLHLPRRLEEVAGERKMTREELLAEMAPLQKRLFDARAERKRPLTDDKILADWNGIAIAGFAVAGRELGEPELVAGARRAARFVLDRMWPRRGDRRGPLLHVWRDGKARLPAFLADYVFLVRGLLALHEASGEAEWLEAAVALTREQIDRLQDPRGGFFATTPSEDLLFRSKETFDSALPAANAVAALNLITLAERAGGESAVRWRREAGATLAAFGRLAESYPDAVRTMTLAARRYGALKPPVDRREPVPPRAVDVLEAEARAVVSASAHLDRGEEGALAGENWRPFRVELKVAEGWHVNANPPSQDFLIATRLEGRGAELRHLRYPEAKQLAAVFSEETLAVYQGVVELTGELRPEGSEPPHLALTYQACDAERCLKPVTVELAVEEGEPER